MNMVQVYIKGQEDKELISFLRYYPVRIKNIGMDAFFDRQVIYDFKDGRNHADVAKCVAKMLVKKFGRKVRSVVFSCVPASSQERNEARNKNFSELVCKFSGAINGFSHVKVVGERTAVHGTKVKKEERAKRLKEKNSGCELLQKQDSLHLGRCGHYRHFILCLHRTIGTSRSARNKRHFPRQDII